MAASVLKPVPDEAPHILVVDDDRRLRDLLARFLGDHGYRVTTAASAADADARLGHLVFDAMVLDVMMPGENGFDFARRLRQSSQVPILMLTARADPTDRINGLEIGVDDYLSKPFEPRELILRLGNVLKRTAQPEAPAAPMRPDYVRFGPFIFGLARGDLRQGEESIRLTEREREILTMLAERAGEHVPREQLANQGSAANDRTIDVQINRLRRKIERDPADPLYLQTVRGIGYRLVVDRPLTSMADASFRRRLVPLVTRAAAGLQAAWNRAATALSTVFKPLRRLPDRSLRPIARIMPQGLYPRALVIVIAPVVLLQSVVAYVFMERHWQTVTQRLSSAVASEISTLIDVYESYPQDDRATILGRIAEDRLGMDVEILPDTDLPAPGARPFFSLLDSALSAELAQQVKRPFWLDTVGRSSLIEIRIKLGKDVMRVLTRRSGAYASNSHIFLLWMIGTSLILLTIAVLFLRNQIRPILKLADAAEAFGKGRDAEFRPRGASEVRRAGNAFIEMKRRVERSIGERTMMLNGVSHDLRTILTRFKLSLALLERSPDLDALEKDVDEMSRMLEDYLAFARGDAGEPPVEADIRALLETLKADAERQGHQTELTVIGDPLVVVRPDAIRRLLTNLVSNAAGFGDRIAIRATHDARYLIVMVDDDGPGIPPELREDVFKPFFRIDEARNVDGGGTGLGLAIARDIARSHGGDIILGESPLGGLRATVRLPV